MKKFLMLFALPLILWGCSNDEPVEQHNDECCEESTVSSQARTENEAFFCALKALSAMEDQEKGTLGRVKRFSSTSRSGYNYTTQEWKEGDTTSFYIFNFDDGGFSIVSTNPRREPVQGMDLDHHFTINSNNPNDIGTFILNLMAMSDEDTYSAIGTGDYTPMDSFKLNLGTVSGLNFDNMVAYPHNDHYCFIVTETSDNSNKVLLNKSWGQERPYNDSCYTTSGLKAYTGCMNTAIGQIMAFYKQPTTYKNHTYSWDYITASPSVPAYSLAGCSVAQLMHDLAVATSTTFGAVNVTGSGTGIEGALQGLRAFGYTSSTSGSYSLSTVKAQINANHPIVCCGKGSGGNHAWVITGWRTTTTTTTYYRETTRKKCCSQMSSTDYVECNWGWDGDYNGYFQSGIFRPNNKDFYSYDIKIIYNIY